MNTDPTLHPDYDTLLDYILHDCDDKIRSYLKDNPNLSHVVAISLNYKAAQNPPSDEGDNKSQQLISEFVSSYIERQHLYPDVLELLYDAVKDGQARVVSQLLKCVNASEICEELYLELIKEATDKEHSHVVPVILENVSGVVCFSKIYVEAVDKLMCQRNPDDDITNAVFYKYIRDISFVDGDLATLGAAFAIDYTPERLKALLAIHGEAMSDRDIKVIFDRALTNSQFDTPHNARAVVPYLRKYPSEYNQDLVLNLFPFPLRELQTLDKGANDFMVTILVRTHIKKTSISLSEALETSPEWLHPYYVELLQ